MDADTLSKAKSISALTISIVNNDIIAKHNNKFVSMSSGFNGERQSKKFIGMVMIMSNLLFLETTNPENSIELRITAILTITNNPHIPPLCIANITMNANIIALMTLFKNILIDIYAMLYQMARQIALYSSKSPVSILISNKSLN